MNSITTFDINILNFIRENLTNPILDRMMICITRLGDGGFIWIVTTITFLVLKKERMLGKVILFSLLINIIIVNLLIKPLVARIRPYDFVEGISILINKPIDYSFPSGHTSIAFAFVSVLWFFGKSKVFKFIFTILAVLVSISRLYLYVHYPTDVLFGFIIGIACGLFTKIIHKNGHLKNYFYKKIE